MRRVFVDTETTGISQAARVVEIGYVMDDDREVEIWVPYDPLTVEPGAHAVNQLGAGGRPLSSFKSRTVRQAVEKLQADWRDAELVFNNPAFDVWMIRKLFEEVPGAEPTWRYHPVDVKMLLLGFAGAATNASREEWLSADVELEPEVHSALEGARLVKRQFEKYEWLRAAR